MLKPNGHLPFHVMYYDVTITIMTSRYATDSTVTPEESDEDESTSVKNTFSNFKTSFFFICSYPREKTFRRIFY